MQVNRLYLKIFPPELRRYCELSLINNPGSTLEEILNSNRGTSRLDRKLNYFLLHSSYGDKWCILSFLGEHFKIYPNSYIIASSQDRGLIEIFLGSSITTERFIFIDQASLNELSCHFRPVSVLSMPLADTWYQEGCMHTLTSFLIKHGLPPGTIRHLHFVYYPYFNELHNLHGISYGTLLRVLLYLPPAAKASLPAFYSEQDYLAANKISKTFNPGTSLPLLPAVLFNVVSFSNASLSVAQASLLISTLESYGYRVLLNVAQSAGFEELASLVGVQHQEAVFVSVPPTLLALVCDNVHAVIGVLGGAMNVACQFSSSHVLSLQTVALGTGCPEEELFGEWGKERIWEWYNHDWPCLHPGRVVENKFIGDPQTIGDAALVNAIKPFLERIRPARAVN